jgi:hypothetical protein
MTTDNDDTNVDNNDGDSGKKKDDTLDAETLKKLEALADAKAEEKLAAIKKKLDDAYARRDEALARTKELEDLEKAKKLKELQEQGKLQEALELQLKEAKDRADKLTQENLNLTRDIQLRNALAGHDFRNESAREMAFRELVGTIVRDSAGNWVSKDGSSISEIVNAFVTSDEHSFLIKQKVSSGSGTGSSGQGGEGAAKPKSLFGMKQADVLKLAAEGKLSR